MFAVVSDAIFLQQIDAKIKPSTDGIISIGFDKILTFLNECLSRYYHVYCTVCVCVC